MDDDAGVVGPAPIDDGWEPEPERPGAWSRMRDGPVGYFRAVPARFFAWLGGLAFVGGWGAAVYVGWLADNGPGLPTTFRTQSMMSIGMQATLAAAVLWGVAAFLWVKVLPAAPDGESNGETGAIPYPP